MTALTEPRATQAEQDRDPDSELLTPRTFQLVDKINEGPDVTTLHIVPTEGTQPEFLPGQVSMLGAFGVGEAAISLSSPVSCTYYHAYTIRRAGPITSALIDAPIGGLITVRGPFGVAWPLSEVATPNLLIIVGGLGIAPLRTLIYQAIEERQRFDELAIVYGARSPENLIYRNDVADWRARGVRVSLTVDEAGPEWDGPVGLVPDLLGPETPAVNGVASESAASENAVDLHWSDTSIFLCGPDVMMHFTALKLIDLGVPQDQIWLTLERNMQCGNGLCGHCQLGPILICRDGPVVNYSAIGRFHRVKAL